jgi:hypothetical protein
MKPWWRWGLLAGLAVGALPAVAAAGRLVIEGLGVTSQGYTYVDYSVESAFEGKALEAIRSGLPSTLTFSLEVWRARPGWWDALEAVRESQLRVLRDPLNDQYVAATTEEVRRFGQLDSLAAAVCLHRRAYLPKLDPSKTYYVVVTSNLAPLSVEDLQELEKWLQGTIRAGDQTNPGGVVGLSGTAVGMLLGFSGFGDVTVRTRSESFVPGALHSERAAPAIAGSRSAGSTAADSALRR